MKNLIGRGFLAAGLMAGLTLNQAEASVLDQSNSFSGNLGFNDQLEWQQQVTAGLSGVLAGIELFTKTGSDTDTVGIKLGNAYTAGPFTFTTTAAITQAGTFIDTSAANITLTAGQHFVIDVSGDATSPGVGGLAGSTSPYAGGDLYLYLGSPIDETTSSNYSMAFQTYVNAVPIPPAALLFPSALGLLGLRRKKTT